MSENILPYEFQSPEQAKQFLEQNQLEGEILNEDDIYEEELLEKNRRYNAYCASHRLLFSPKRETSLPSWKPFNNRFRAPRFHHPSVKKPKPRRYDE